MMSLSISFWSYCTVIVLVCLHIFMEGYQNLDEVMVQNAECIAQVQYMRYRTAYVSYNVSENN